MDNQKHTGQVHTADEVEQKLSAGEWNVSREVDCDRNYWSYSCRLATLMRFVEACSVSVLQHKFWDVCLVKYLTRCTKMTTIVGVREAAECWMYLWRFDDQLDHSCAKPTGLTELTGMEAAIRRNLALYCSLQPLAAHSKSACAMFMQPSLEGSGSSPQQKLAMQKCMQKLIKKPEFLALLHSPEYK